MTQIQDLGEQGLLSLLQQFCPAAIIGDDAAVVAMPPGRSLVVTTDLLVDGVHFSDRTTSPEDVGWRAAAANLSDLAAMGAMPLGITVGLGLPGEVSVDWVERLYQGLSACLQSYQTPIVGGDVCRSPVRTIAIAAYGEVHPERVIRRSVAQPGDAILVTGRHGASRAGLELLWHPDSGQELSDPVRSQLIQAHQRPRPRLDVLPLLWESWQAWQMVSSRSATETASEHRSHNQAFRVAGMDSSDGLADAVLQICRMSRVGATLERGRIPMPLGLQPWLTPAQILDWVLYGGEDFELVLCLPLELAQILVKRLGTDAAIVGTITDTSNVVLVESSDQPSGVELTMSRGFQHFSS